MAAAGSAWLLFLARAIDGITGGNIIIAQAYVADITPPEKRTEAFGYIFAAFGIGFIIGPALGGLLSAWFGARRCWQGRLRAWHSTNSATAWSRNGSASCASRLCSGSDD